MPVGQTINIVFFCGRVFVSLICEEKALCVGRENHLAMVAYDDGGDGSLLSLFFVVVAVVPVAATTTTNNDRYERDMSEPNNFCLLNTSSSA